jgi:serine protease
MQKNYLILLLLICPVFVYSQVFSPDYEDGQLWVRYKNAPISRVTADASRRMYGAKKEVKLTGISDNQSLRKTYGIEHTTAPFVDIKGESPLKQTYLLTFTNGEKIEDLIEQLRQDKSIEYVERVPILKSTAVPNDPSYVTQWHLAKIGASNAWNSFSTGSNVVIAIVDDAVDRTHPDLAANLWVNTSEIAGNGIDDDQNGFVDDINGWNFADNDNNPNPLNASFDHGTHVAGISSAATNNGVGVSGMGFSAKIMAIKTTKTPGVISFGYSGIVYAADNGADIINCSWGGTGSSITALEIINYALSRGSIIVAAAGNSNSSAPLYPAAYPGVVSVASTNSSDVKSSFSSYNASVTVSAPGSNIYSTLPGNTYGYKSGTSMAAPLVSGLLSLMRALNPNIPNSAMVNCLTSTAVNIDALNPVFVGQLGAGRINADAAMQCITASLSHPPVADFTTSITTINAGGFVQFRDQSTYGPTSWNWSFAGGTPSSFIGTTPPTIQYTTPGTYEVSLTVSNANGTDTKMRTGHITVGPALTCVRPNFPAPSEWTATRYYTGAVEGVDGWINGLSVYEDKEKAMFYDVSASNVTYLTGVLIAFGRGQSANPAKLVPVHIYDGTAGTPGAQLGTVNLTMGEIMADVSASRYTMVEFTTPVTLPVSKKLFVSVDLTALEWTATVKDELTILSNANGQTTPTPIWEKQSDGQWYRYTTAGSWNLSASLYIHPYLTKDPPLASITSSATAICSGNIIEFNAAGSTFQNGIQWQYPGGSPTTSTNVSQSVKFDTPGTYQIKLSVRGGGCDQYRESTVSVTVAQTPVVAVNISKNPICAGESTSLSASGATTYAWFPSNMLNTDAGPNVVASPTASAAFTVVGTIGSCQTSVPISIDVRPVTSSVTVVPSANNVYVGTQITFTATPQNGGANPLFNFMKNNASVQSGPLPVWSSTSLADNDVISCAMTSNESCVTEPLVNSNNITMEISDPLPVSLLYFASSPTESGHLLKWEVTGESNSAYYLVERSVDAKKFDQIGKVAVTEVSGRKVYTFDDRMPLAGINYYRLKMVDTDGTYAYSFIVAQKSEITARTIEAFPNPVTLESEIQISLNGIGTETVSVNLINPLGQVVRRYRVKGSGNSSSFRIPASSLNGTYYVTCFNENGFMIGTSKLIVVK